MAVHERAAAAVCGASDKVDRIFEVVEKVCRLVVFHVDAQVLAIRGRLDVVIDDTLYFNAACCRRNQDQERLTPAASACIVWSDAVVDDLR